MNGPTLLSEAALYPKLRCQAIVGKLLNYLIFIHKNKFNLS